MIDANDKRFFQALKDTCATIDAVGKPCRDAVEHALTSEDPAAMRAARLAVDALDDKVRDQVLVQVHRRMATDLSAIWEGLSTATTGGRPN